MSENIRKPQAFVIEDEKPSKRAKAKISFTAEQPAQELITVPNPVPMPTSRGLRWGSILFTTLVGLFSLWSVLTITQLIESFFARSPLLGWIAFSLACLAAVAALAIISREVLDLARSRQIEKLQLTATHALNQDDEASAKIAIAGLTDLYRGKPDAAWNLKNFETHANDILDPRDRVRLAERFLVDPLDETAHRIIAKRAKRVTLLTTVTPAAALDIIFVAAQNMIMLREIATLYGGRPSTFATLRLARMVVTHLAIAGGLALSDNFLHLFVGKGLLGRLSARFGEGAVNGILTSRIGLAAVDVCRPIPKETTKRETLGSLLKELANFSSKDKDQFEPRE